ncbi:MAG TPA: hypothetical protein VFB66_26795 [Tepidisphaeraceae bacterium]|nr:hypothetical protein [Tepidisphaeraceae bacterium]
MATGKRSSGRTLATGLGVIAVVGAATLLAILFRGGGSGSGGTGTGAGSGTGTGTTMPATQAALPQQPQRPLKVTIQESTYLVNGQPVDLATLTQLAAKVPPGEGAAVLVDRSPTSRAKAEKDLLDSLTKQGISHAGLVH